MPDKSDMPEIDANHCTYEQWLAMGKPPADKSWSAEDQRRDDELAMYETEFGPRAADEARNLIEADEGRMTDSSVFAREFRLRWQREGLPMRRKLYQSREPAEHYALLLQGRMAEFTGDEPTAYACCSGWECGCGGITNADAWALRAKDLPLLIWGPVIESREVGAWGND